MSVRNYINMARAGAHQRYRSMDGSNNGYLNAVGATANNQRIVRSKFQADGGTGGATGMYAPQSKPYIITVSNASAAAVANFDILGAYQYLQDPGFSNGSLTRLGITISSGISNVTYQQLLYQSMNQPFTSGMLYIQSLSGSASQITQPFTLNTQDANGDQALSTVTVLKDPYQQQTDVVSINRIFNVDGFTKLTITTILASVVFQMSFFPSQNINTGAALVGGNVAQPYSNPGVSALLAR